MADGINITSNRWTPTMLTEAYAAADLIYATAVYEMFLGSRPAKKPLVMIMVDK